MRKVVTIIILVITLSSFSQVMANQLGQSRIASLVQSPRPNPLSTPTPMSPSNNKGIDPLVNLNPDLKDLTHKAIPGALGSISLGTHKITNQPEKLTEHLAAYGVTEEYVEVIIRKVKNVPVPVKGALLAVGLGGIVTSLCSFIFKGKGPSYIVGGLVSVTVFFGYLFLHKKKVVK